MFNRKWKEIVVEVLLLTVIVIVASPLVMAISGFIVTQIEQKFNQITINSIWPEKLFTLREGDEAWLVRQGNLHYRYKYINGDWWYLEEESGWQEEPSNFSPENKVEHF
jgi:hypothetical protein